MDLTEFDKVFSGKFVYWDWDDKYCEEIFTVSQEPQTLNLHYQADLSSRLSTGEFLKISVHSFLTRSYLPIEITVRRSVGKDAITEKYLIDSKQGNLVYNFQSDKNNKKVKLNTPNKFHIATPDITTTMLFIGLKKYDSTGKNFYNIMLSNNNWKFNKSPAIFTVLLNRVGTQRELNVAGSNVKGSKYEVYSKADYERRGEDPTAVFLSPHFNVPFVVWGKSGNKIEMSSFKIYQKPNYNV